jgi:ketosteroid isomerase-like protein
MTEAPMRHWKIVIAGAVAAALSRTLVALPDAAAVKDALLAVDKEFSAEAQKVGVAEAFARYAAPDARMLPQGKDVVSGLDAVRRQMAGFPAKATLSWKPFHADVAASGDLGYTLGTYELRATDETGKTNVSYGKYCSVWKKQSDGKWKWVVDVGTSSPEPKGN